MGKLPILSLTRNIPRTECLKVVVEKINLWERKSKKKFRSSPPGVFLEQVCWNYSANLQENTNAEVRF